MAVTCSDGTRRVVTLEVAADESESYSFTSTPLADPLVVLAPAALSTVAIELTADGATWGEAFSYGGLVTPVAQTLPRSAAGVRIVAGSEAVTATISIIEAD